MLIHDTAARQPGETTSGTACTGIRKAEADAVAFTICARYGITTTHQLADPAAWAGTDPRAQPAAAVLAAGERIAAAAAQIIRRLDHTLLSESYGVPSPGQVHVDEPPPQAPPQQTTAGTSEQALAPAEVLPAPDDKAARILNDAAAFYTARLAGNWAPDYLAARGISSQTAGSWQIGYAPAGWIVLTDHLRKAGYTDGEIEAAGLARRSSRGTLIDHFRDRIMLPVHDADGQIAGFTGRARPGHAPTVPKYLNSPQTSLYRKGDLLFGLHQARGPLAAGAIPVIVEGPFDAIAVTIAGDGRYAGLAPCGTALTDRQAVLLGQSCDLARTGAIVAFDPDPAGRKAAIRAYGILRPLTAILRSAALTGRDPAQILEEEGVHALRDALTAPAQPLLGVIVDAEISRLEYQLGDADGPFRAMRAAAATLAGLLPADTAAKIRKTAAGTEPAAAGDQMRPIAFPQLPGIARALPADTLWAVARLADRFGLMASDALIELAGAVTRQPASGDRAGRPAAHLAAGSFPGPPPQSPPAERPAGPPRHAQARRPRPPGHRR